MTSPVAIRRILGVDPGLRATGFGIVEFGSGRLVCITCGCIRSGDGELPERLGVIVRDLATLIAQHRPTEVAVEKVFVNINPQSTLLLGQARGAAISAAVLARLPVAEYTALQVKQAVVGHGKAAKGQVQEMVRRLLELPGAPSPDAADALACAIAHAHAAQGLLGLRTTGFRMRARAPRLMRRRAARSRRCGVRHGRPHARHRAHRAPLLERGGDRRWGSSSTARSLSSMIGRNARDSRQFVLAHHGADFPIDALMQESRRNFDAIVTREGIAVKAGLHALLDWLDSTSVPRVVATSTRRERAQAHLERCGLRSRFDALVGGDEVTHGKPAPDIFLLAASRLDVGPADCVVLEDSEPGVRGALAAGMIPIMVPDMVAPSRRSPCLRAARARLAHRRQERTSLRCRADCRRRPACHNRGS